MVLVDPWKSLELPHAKNSTKIISISPLSNSIGTNAQLTYSLRIGVGELLKCSRSMSPKSSRWSLTSTSDMSGIDWQFDVDPDGDGECT